MTMSSTEQPGWVALMCCEERGRTETMSGGMTDGCMHTVGKGVKWTRKGCVMNTIMCIYCGGLEASHNGSK